MSARRARVAALLAPVVLLGAIAGCGLILGLPEVSVEAPDTGADAAIEAAVDAGPDAPRDPTYVFGAGPCQACLASSCATRATECGGDPACTAFVSCLRCCGDPACPKQPDELNKKYFSPACYDGCALDNGGVNTSDDPSKLSAYDNLLACAGKSCRQECAIGNDFECLGDYSWPNPTTQTISVGFRVTDAVFQGPVDAGRVTACAEGETCLLDAAAQPLSADGVDLTLKVTNTNGLPQAWVGHFAIRPGLPDAAAVFPTILFRRNRPEYRDRPLSTSSPREIIPITSKQTVQDAYSFLNLSPQLPNTGTIVGAMQDCRTLYPTFADGVVVTVEGSPALRAYYVKEPSKFPEVEAGATNINGQFVIPNVPPGKPTLVFTRRGVEVAKFPVDVQVGAVTQLGVWPSAKK